MGAAAPLTSVAVKGMCPFARAGRQAKVQVDVDVVQRPSGTVTFVLTDIEGSTRWWGADAASMDLALRGHDTLIRESAREDGGYVFSTAGDSFAIERPCAPEESTRGS